MEEKAVTAFGLFCNLIGPDAEKAVSQMRRVLKPDGLLYVSDCLRLDSGFDWALRVEMSRAELLALQERWAKRYRENAKLGLPYGTFLVFKMGHKEKEYDGAGKLKEHLKNPEIFERFTRHWGWDEFQRLFRGSFWWDYMAPQVFRSRTGEPLLEISMVFKKQRSLNSYF